MVCGVRDGENIRELLATDIDILGFVFCSDSPQVVKMIPSNSGIIPDYSRDRYLQQRGQEINGVETSACKAVLVSLQMTCHRISSHAFITMILIMCNCKETRVL